MECRRGQNRLHTLLRRLQNHLYTTKKQEVEVLSVESIKNRQLTKNV